MKYTILRITDSTQQTNGQLHKLIGLIDAKSLFALIDSSDLQANPRFAKSGRVTSDILESLEKSPELFPFKSKGILVSSRECIALERKRYKLKFEDPQLEGIMDGGHNTFALALFLMRKALPERKFNIKGWNELREPWEEFKTEVEEYIKSEPDDLNFKVPIEVIYPEGQYLAEYTDHILEISEARNNNSELTETAKGNHAGFYKELAARMDSSLASKVEWKTNELGKSIKSQDVIALSLIPFLALDKSEKIKLPTINKVSLYSGKGSCIKTFNSIIEENMTDDSKPNEIRFESDLISSAFDLMKDIPRIYDSIYKSFGHAYNKNGGSFGRIDKVDSIKEGEKKGKGFYTKFYGIETDYSYPDGFIYPVVVSLNKLIEVKDGKVQWKVQNPEQFMIENLTQIISMLSQFIRSKNYDPQQVGKDSGSYQAVEMTIEMLLMQEGLKK
jgi:hypothetical protein